jgi:hypothetical protein
MRRRTRKERDRNEMVYVDLGLGRHLLKAFWNFIWKKYAPSSQVPTWGDLSSAPHSLKIFADRLAQNFSLASREVLPGRTKLYRNFWSVPLSRMRYVHAALELLPFALRGEWPDQEKEAQLISLFVAFNSYESAFRSSSQLPMRQPFVMDAVREREREREREKREEKQERSEERRERGEKTWSEVL